MSGLKRRLTRRRAIEPETAAGPPGASPADLPAEPSPERSLLEDPADEQPTERLPVTQAPAEAAPAEAPAVPPPDDLPAGLDPAELAAAPDTSARRGRLRRRVEFLRSARELLLRDLGGFVFELHRTARDTEQEGHRRLRAIKLERLDAVEAELHALEQRLRDPRPNVVVREPGVGGECHRCGELHGSDANYCAHCGAPLTESARKERLKPERRAGGPAGGEPVTAPDGERATAVGGEEAAGDKPAAPPAGDESPASPDDAPRDAAAGTTGEEPPEGPRSEHAGSPNGASPDAVTEVQRPS